MRYAALLCLLMASEARANGWEWKRQPITDYDRAEIRRVATLTALPRCVLEAEVEGQRDAFNRQTLMQYNRMRPYTPMTRPMGAR